MNLKIKKSWINTKIKYITNLKVAKISLNIRKVIIFMIYNKWKRDMNLEDKNLL